MTFPVTLKNASLRYVKVSIYYFSNGTIASCVRHWRKTMNHCREKGSELCHLFDVAYFATMITSLIFCWLTVISNLPRKGWIGYLFTSLIRINKLKANAYKAYSWKGIFTWLRIVFIMRISFVFLALALCSGQRVELV